MVMSGGHISGWATSGSVARARGRRFLKFGAALLVLENLGLETTYESRLVPLGLFVRLQPATVRAGFLLQTVPKFVVLSDKHAGVRRGGTRGRTRHSVGGTRGGHYSGGA